MAKFKSSPGKQVMYAGRIMTIAGGEIETTDQGLISALRKAKGVAEIKKRQQQASD